MAKRVWRCDLASFLAVAGTVSLTIGTLMEPAEAQRGGRGGGPLGGRGGPPPAARLESIRMPPGFAIATYADGVQAARSLSA
jgi:hypothetical protein